MRETGAPIINQAIQQQNSFIILFTLCFICRLIKSNIKRITLSSYYTNQGSLVIIIPTFFNNWTKINNKEMSKDKDLDSEEGIAVQEAKPKLEQPKRYKVILLNDDYTPMDFVVHILEYFFSLDRAQATQVMLQVHTQGKGVCGIYPKDIAETKEEQVNRYSKSEQHPLMCVIEEA